MTDQIDPKIIDRIRKLLALANDGGATEAEAELAMGKAQEIMADHNLTMAALEKAGGAKEARRKENSRENLMYPWKRQLLQTIARVNFCHLVLLYKTTASNQQIGGGYELIGRESNIVATRNMWTYLLGTIERLLVEQVGTSPQERYTRWAHSFRLGMVQRLCERLDDRLETIIREQERKAREEKARAAHPAAATGTALAIVLRDFVQDEEDLNHDLKYGYEPGTTARRRAERAAAYEEAKRVQAEVRARLKAEHPEYSDELIDLLVAGVDLDRALVLTGAKPKTAKQRRKEEAAERASERYWEARARARDRAAAKIDWDAHDIGRQTADGVGFDDQIDRNETKKLGR